MGLNCDAAYFLWFVVVCDLSSIIVMFDQCARPLSLVHVPAMNRVTVYSYSRELQ